MSDLNVSALTEMCRGCIPCMGPGSRIINVCSASAYLPLEGLNVYSATKAYVAANQGLTILDGAWVEEQYCAAVDEGNTALLEAINTALNELIADGTVKQIVDKYITAD